MCPLLSLEYLGREKGIEDELLEIAAACEGLEVGIGRGVLEIVPPSRDRLVQAGHRLVTESPLPFAIATVLRSVEEGTQRANSPAALYSSLASFGHRATLSLMIEAAFEGWSLHLSTEARPSRHELRVCR